MNAFCDHEKFPIAFRSAGHTRNSFSQLKGIMKAVVKWQSFLMGFKEIVSPKNVNLLKISSPSGHPRCRWVCFFTRTDLEKCSFASLAHQWILCSESVPSESESKQLKTTGDGLFHWRECYYGFWTDILDRSNNVKLKCCNAVICFLQTCIFWLHKTSIDGLEWCGLLVDYCDVFISCLDSHSDGTHSLQRIHWWASDEMLYFFKSVPTKKQTHLHLGWPEGE